MDKKCTKTRRPGKNPEKDWNPEEIRKPEKSGTFPGNPEDLATLVRTLTIEFISDFYTKLSIEAFFLVFRER